MQRFEQLQREAREHGLTLRTFRTTGSNYYEDAALIIAVDGPEHLNNRRSPRVVWVRDVSYSIGRPDPGRNKWSRALAAAARVIRSKGERARMHKMYAAEVARRATAREERKQAKRDQAAWERSPLTVALRTSHTAEITGCREQRDAAAGQASDLRAALSAAQATLSETQRELREANRTVQTLATQVDTLHAEITQRSFDRLEGSLEPDPGIQPGQIATGSEIAYRHGDAVEIGVITARRMPAGFDAMFRQGHYLIGTRQVQPQDILTVLHGAVGLPLPKGANK